MKDMNLIFSLNDYSIYKNEKYFLCMPNEPNNYYHIFMGFSNKDLKNIPEEELIKEIRLIGDSVNVAYKNGIYVLPIIPPKQLEEAASENDDRLYNKILNNIIQPITYSIYSQLATQKMRVSHTIKMIKQNDIDTKLVGWLYLKLGSIFIKEITFDNSPQDNNLNKEQELNTQPNYNKSLFTDYTDNEFEKQELYISESLKAATSPGFGSLRFMLLLLSIFTVLGSIIMYMILK